MQNLEHKIQENIDEVFDFKMESGHRQRFEQKLAIQRKQKRTFHLTWLKYAAAAAAITVTFFIFELQTSENENISRYDVHIVEVERYYAMQLDNEISTTTQLLNNVDEQYRDELLHDIKLMLTSENNIPNALDDEAETAVIVSVYTRKIESLQNLQSNLLAYNKN
jgi:hypothetical protein